MKKAIITAVIAVSMLGLTASSFAATYTKIAGASYVVVDGQVVSVNPKGWFVIQDKDGGAQRTVYAFAKDLDSLSAGDHVRVTLPQPGSLASKIQK